MTSIPISGLIANIDPSDLPPGPAGPPGAGRVVDYGSVTPLPPGFEVTQTDFVPVGSGLGVVIPCASGDRVKISVRGIFGHNSSTGLVAFSIFKNGVDQSLPGDTGMSHGRMSQFDEVKEFNIEYLDLNPGVGDIEYELRWKVWVGRGIIGRRHYDTLVMQHTVMNWEKLI